MKDPETADIRNALLQVLVFQYAQKQAMEEMQEELRANAKRAQAKATADVALEFLLCVVVIFYLVTLGGVT